MNRTKLAVIGVGNMAKAIIKGILDSDASISKIILYDTNESQYTSLPFSDKIVCAESISEAVSSADSVLLSVKPQIYNTVMNEIKAVSGYADKLYISIGAGISTESVRFVLGSDISVIRVLPNVPMMIGNGVSVICRNDDVCADDFNYVKGIFASSGSILEIDETEMNRIIGVTSSSPAYVFKFIDSICEGAKAQGITYDNIVDIVCDVVIGSALMLKNGNESANELISRVASKGGTTEKALETLDEFDFSEGIIRAMKACSSRADELGS